MLCYVSCLCSQHGPIGGNISAFIILYITFWKQMDRYVDNDKKRGFLSLGAPFGE